MIDWRFLVFTHLIKRLLFLFTRRRLVCWSRSIAGGPRVNAISFRLFITSFFLTWMDIYKHTMCTHYCKYYISHISHWLNNFIKVPFRHIGKYVPIWKRSEINKKIAGGCRLEIETWAWARMLAWPWSRTMSDQLQLLLNVWWGDSPLLTSHSHGQLPTPQPGRSI